MNKSKLILIAVASVIVSTSASSATLMLRQEYLPKATKANPVNKNATLAKIGGSVGNTFFAVQSVNKGEKLNSYAVSSTELQLGHRYNINETFRLIPKLDVTSTKSGSAYKPQLGFVTNWGGGFSTELKYKHEYFVRSDSKPTTEKSQYQLNLNYKIEKLRLGLQYDYHKGLDEQKYYNNHDFKQELELKGYYTVAKGLTPFLTFAGVPVSGKSDEYQLRTRVGLLYSF